MLLFALLPADAPGAEAEGLRALLAGEAKFLEVGGRAVEAQPLRRFYGERDYRPAWSGPEREASGDTLLMALQSVAVEEGLESESYAVPATGSDSERDLLVSDAALRLARDLGRGRATPLRAFGGLGADAAGGAAPPRRLLADLAEGEPPQQLLAGLPPAYLGYARLREAYARYRAAAAMGGWDAVPDGAAVKPGEESERIPALRKRLIASGDLPGDKAEGNLLDAEVEAALRRVQARHGLKVDGALGSRTVAALNVPAEARALQIALNLERWRWMPRALPATHIAVNLPAATLELVEGGEVRMAMRVVVGDVRHPTPGLAATMTSVVLNPTWTVPPAIASREILPKLRRDPTYLAANNYRILDAFPEDSPEAVGGGTDWSVFPGNRFPYRLRQQSGPGNALGLVKFTLRDSDDIYLHDTPQKQFFGRDYRALSHGCVRVEKPRELAEALLGEEWRGKVGAIIDGKDTTILKLERQPIVYLLYFTAWADSEGEVHFRDDIYGHDRRLATALGLAPLPSRLAVSYSPRSKSAGERR